MRKKKEKERRELVRQYAIARQTAFHEAGHVVFAMLKGPGVEIATIDPQRVKELTGQEYPGYTRYPESGPANSDIVLCLTAAGLTSEAMFITGGVVSAQEDDIRQINEFLENQLLGLRGPEKQRELDRIRLLTQQFVAQNRTAIEVVTNALLERKTLSGKTFSAFWLARN